MIVKSIKVTKWKLAAVIGVIGVFLCLIVWLVPGKEEQKDAGAVASVGASDSEKLKAGEKEEERIAYLTSFGWEAEQPAAQSAEVLIPNEFNETMEKYNDLQKKQGFDLEKFKGQRVKRYTYKIINYPDEAQGDVAANIYVANGKIIGGDISSTQLDGFMHGFNME